MPCQAPLFYLQFLKLKTKKKCACRHIDKRWGMLKSGYAHPWTQWTTLEFIKVLFLCVMVRPGLRVRYVTFDNVSAVSFIGEYTRVAKWKPLICHKSPKKTVMCKVESSTSLIDDNRIFSFCDDGHRLHKMYNLGGRLCASYDDVRFWLTHYISSRLPLRFSWHLLDNLEDKSVVRDSFAVRRNFVRLAGAVRRQSAIHKENSGFTAPTLVRYISTFQKVHYR